MQLTSQQIATLKTAILADPVFGPIASDPNQRTDGNAAIIAANFNLDASPAFWVWRTNVARAEIYTAQNDLGVAAPDDFWNWATYKAQSIVEQNSWVQMFMGDQADFSKANLRSGVQTIFGNTTAQTAQRNHVLAIARRKASRAEKLYATGTGSTALPAVMGVEGALEAQNVKDAWNS